jgi:hypothetical protein
MALGKVKAAGWSLFALMPESEPSTNVAPRYLYLHGLASGRFMAMSSL